MNDKIMKNQIFLHHYTGPIIAITQTVTADIHVSLFGSHSSFWLSG